MKNERKNECQIAMNWLTLPLSNIFIALEVEVEERDWYQK